MLCAKLEINCCCFPLLSISFLTFSQVFWLFPWNERIRPVFIFLAGYCRHNSCRWSESWFVHKLLFPIKLNVSLTDILVNKTAIQLNFFQQSINLKQNFEKAIYYKVYSVNTSTNARSIDNVAHSRLVPDKAQFEPQPNSGVLHKPSQLVTFYSNSTNASQTVLYNSTINSI